MSETHSVLLLTHITFGAIVLLVFWIPISTRKGGRTHRRGGRLYLWAGRVVVATALISCAWALIDPTERIGSGDLSRDAAGSIRDVRFFFGFLGVLGTIALAEMERGVFTIARVARRSASTWLTAVAALAGSSSLASGLWGAVTLATGGVAWHGLVRLGLAAFGLDIAWRTYRAVRSTAPDNRARKVAHLDAMLGSAAAFYTAFAVFGFGRLVGLEVLKGGPLGVVPWIAPAIGAIVLTRWWKRRITSPDGISPLRAG